jgi:hypothetical protein
MDGENENASVEAMDGESDDDKVMVGLQTQSSNPEQSMRTPRLQQADKVATS